MTVACETTGLPSLSITPSLPTSARNPGGNGTPELTTTALRSTPLRSCTVSGNFSCPAL